MPELLGIIGLIEFIDTVDRKIGIRQCPFYENGTCKLGNSADESCQAVAPLEDFKKALRELSNEENVEGIISKLSEAGIIELCRAVEVREETEPSLAKGIAGAVLGSATPIAPIAIPIGFLLGLASGKTKKVEIPHNYVKFKILRRIESEE